MFLVVIGICDPDTHTQRHCHLIADFNRLNALQDTEFILDQLFQIFFLKYYKILISFNFLDDTVALGKIFAYLPVNQSYQQRTLDLLDALQRFLIIINADLCGHKLLLFVLADIAV